MNAKTNKTKLGAEMLESREMMSVTSALLSGSVVTVRTDNVATSVSVKPNPTTGGIKIVDGGNGLNWSFTGVNQVNIVGGAGNDIISNYVPGVALQAWGQGGNDRLEGDGGADALMGGDGNDTLVGFGGNDRLWGGAGNDILRGMDANDTLYGEAGNDALIGAGGTDYLYGGDGDDALVNIDGTTGDTADGGNGRDTIWQDIIGTAKDIATAEKVYNVASFASVGGVAVDRTLDGDKIADPTDGTYYRSFRNNPLFADNGPTINDIDQNEAGDCWILGTLGASVGDNKYVGREMVADFGDGTYGVRLGDKFYRVDADLATTTLGSLKFAGLGQQNSLWVAIVEKAYANYRTGANTYASLNGGDCDEVFRAIGMTNVGHSDYLAGSNPATVANDLYNHWRWVNNSCTFNTATVPPGSPAGLVAAHVYAVTDIKCDASGKVTSIWIRNPWGADRGDPDIKLTPEQLAACRIGLHWGTSA